MSGRSARSWPTSSRSPAPRAIRAYDFHLDLPSGPRKAARVAAERVKAELGKAGYAVAAEHGFLPRTYFLVFSPK